ncbi:T9SS type A sorting domain-containing protein [Rubrivirga sp.]|uniref:T9SS type A sorting domain-containing protein n=1 Tax=Rubrivirga sp. TaxID=1885344 RepID=UPI003C746F5D
MTRSIALLAATLALLVAPAHAQPVLESLEGPAGGSAWSVLAQSDGDVVVGTYDGLTSAFRSSDGGQTWTYLDALPPARYEAFARSADGVLFAASRADVQRSRDGGVTWEARRPDGGFGRVSDLVLDDEGRVFVGSRSTGVVRSLDGGDTWEAVGAGLDTMLVTALEVAPGRLLAGGAGRVHSSDDGGTTWTSVSDGLPDADVSSLLVTSTGRTLAATASGLYRLEVGASRWEEVTEGVSSSPTARYYALAALASGRLLASTYSVVYLSDDGGTTWRASDGPNMSGVYTLAEAGPGQVIAPTFDGGVWRSNDGGTTWASANDGFLNTRVTSLALDGEGRLLAGTQQARPANASRWDPTSRRWESLTARGLTGFRVYAMTRTNAGTLLAGTDSGLYLSTDGGASWTRSQDVTRTVYSVAETTAGTLLAGTFDQGVARSRDGGASWTFVDTPEGRVRVVASAPDGTVYAGLDNASNRAVPGGVLRSDDDGVTWSFVNSGFGFEPSRTQALAADRSGTVYASFSERPGPFRSDDQGATWTEVRSGLSGSTALLATDRRGVVVVAQSDGSLYQSRDGSPWDAIVGPTGLVPAALAVEDDGRVYFGTVGRGVYRTAELVAVDAESAPTSDLEVVAFPNPVRTTATVRLRLDAPSDVHVTVLDATGRIVAVLAGESLGTGVHDLEWAPTVASGVYIVRAEVGAEVVTRQLTVVR